MHLLLQLPHSAHTPCIPILTEHRSRSGAGCCVGLACRVILGVIIYARYCSCAYSSRSNVEELPGYLNRLVFLPCEGSRWKETNTAPLQKKLKLNQAVLTTTAFSPLCVEVISQQRSETRALTTRNCLGVLGFFFLKKAKNYKLIYVKDPLSKSCHQNIFLKSIICHLFLLPHVPLTFSPLSIRQGERGFLAGQS